MNWIETAGFVTGILGVWLTIKQNNWCWPLWFVCTIFYLIIFLDAKLFADMWLQVFYLITIGYGWYKWTTKTSMDEDSSVSFSDFKLLAIAAISIIGLTMILGYLFSHYTSAAIPWLDSTLSAASIIATWLTAKKKLENWVIWIIADSMYVLVYCFKDLYITAVFYFILLILAIEGYHQWKGAWKKIEY